MYPAYLILLFLYPLMDSTCNAEEDNQYRSGLYPKPEDNHCSPFSCGKLHGIRYPFWLKTHSKTRPKNCGDERYSLSCENNITKLQLYAEKYHVEAINYDNQTIRIADPNVQRNNCSSLPRCSLSDYNFSYGDPYELSQLKTSVIFLSCEDPVMSTLYVERSAGSCANTDALTQSKRHSYVVVNGSVSDLVDSCTVELMFMVSSLERSYGKPSFYTRIRYQRMNNLLI